MGNKIKSGRRYKKHNLLSRHPFASIFVFLLISGSAWFYHELSSLKVATVWFETEVASNGVISLPKDDAPHQSKMEWWYYNGHLVTETGKKYSFHDTIFFVNGVITQLVNHISFADYQTRQYLIDQRGTAGSFGLAPANRFDFAFDDWNMSGGNGVDKLQVSTDEFSFDLKLISSQPPVFHGKDGIISLGHAGNSYYYSRPRMDIAGTVKIKGHTETVKGIAWFDHQWGDFSTPQLSWEWFSLQLDNNSDIMVYQLRDKLNRLILYTGSITQNGKTEILASSDFSMSAGKKWISPKTSISYPLEWKIKIPSKNIALTIKSILSDSEFDAKLTTYNIYWEGAIQVTGSHTGKGFMELHYFQ